MKTVVVTGANRGIGLEFVKQYQQLGWQIVAGCRAPEQATELNGLQTNGNLTVVPLDVADPASRERFCSVLGEQAVHLLINNAGVYGPKEVTLNDVDEAQWLEVFRVNTVAPLKLVALLRRNLAAASVATVACLSSKMGSMSDNGSGGVYLYRSSKAGLNAVVKSLSIDLADENIRVVALHPGWVQTEMGGPNALISAQDSVAGITRVLEHLSAQQSGSFIGYDGTIIPW